MKQQISRREFIKLCSASAMALGLSQVWTPQVTEAFNKAAGDLPPILWVRGSACGSCSTSLLNTVHPDIRELLTEIINLSFHPDFSSRISPPFVDHVRELARSNRGKFILVLEGSIPTAGDGSFNIVGEDAAGKKVTFLHYIRELSEMAGTVVTVGSCAAYGGVSAAKPNDAKCLGLEKVIGTAKVVNIPGCPPHPDWIVGTLAHIVLDGSPKVDDFGRPEMFFQGLIHNNCPRRQYFDNSIFARHLGEEGCLLYVGCKGPLAHGDCPTRLWNGASSWCVNVNGPCIGCTNPSFPELTMPFYKRMPEIRGPGITFTADAVGLGLGALTAAGIAAHLAGSYFNGRIGSKKEEKEGEA